MIRAEKDMSRVETASQTTSGTKDSIGVRNTLRRWKDKWRTNSATSSRASSPGAPLFRLASNTSSASPAPTSAPKSVPVAAPLPAPASIPSITSPPPPPAALFTPTTETFIHSPADPRNRSRNTSASTSPSATLKKSPPLSRRNTAPSDFLSHAHHEGHLPMNVVTTTIVAGNGKDCAKRKRTSRLRLSISKRGSILPSPPNSPPLHGHYDRSSSRAASRFESVPEAERRKRVDSDGETLTEVVELIKRDRPKVPGREGEEGTVELAYQYVN